MFYCENSHNAIFRIQVADGNGALVADSRNMPAALTNQIIEDMQMGECPVCSGKMPLIQNAVK